MNKPILTLFLLTYNHEIYLDGESESLIEQCLKSIVEQECSYPFIVKVLEDCSTDGTLAICKQYQAMYPNLIQIIAQKENTLSKKDVSLNHIMIALKNEINTPYWCLIEGDDRYCYKYKLQEAIDFLEKNQSFNCYGTNCLRTFVGFEITKTIETEDCLQIVSFDKHFHIPMSARVFRNVIDFKQTKNLFLRDTFIFYLFFDNGYTFYDNKITSVYNVTYKGVYTGASPKERIESNLSVYVNCLEYFSPKYSDFFERKITMCKKDLDNLENPPKTEDKPVPKPKIDVPKPKASTKKTTKWYIKHSIKMLTPPIIIKVAKKMLGK